MNYCVGKKITALLLGCGLAMSTSAPAQIERISVTDTGQEANFDSYEAAVSDDGSIVAFRSSATNLVPGDTNNWSDIFVRDLNTDSTEIISLQPDGSETDSYSQHPELSDDGLVVAYQSKYDTPAGTTSGLTVITVTERLPGPNVTTHLQLSFVPGNNDAEARLHPSISGNGQFVGFETRVTLQQTEPASARPVNDDNNAAWDTFVYDRLTVPTPPTLRVSRDSADNQSDGDSYHTSLSDDGQFVAFYSFATNLVPGDDNASEDIFVRNIGTGSTELISVANGGGPSNGDSYSPKVSGNGQFVAFRSLADNLVNGDNNDRWDIFVRDRLASTTERISVSSSGEEANHSSFEPSISDDGRFVAFRSNASNLVDDDRNQRFDIFVHDRQAGQTVRVGQPGSSESNGHSYQPAISGNGQWIVFESDATNLIANDTNQARDIFRVPNPLATGSRNSGGQ